MSKLIVTQKLGEVLHIGEDIKVSVYKVKGSYVRICIQAPPHIRILRDSVKKKEEGHGTT